MNAAHIITDIGFGDSGKGAIADRIAATINPDLHTVVLRYTGGSQAGHTVDLNAPGESDPMKRHIHSSFAAGTLAGFSSHMSNYCPIYPQNLVREAAVLREKIGYKYNQERLTVDPLAPMITVYDVAWNRMMQTGTDTVGLGIGATMERMLNTDAKTFMSDLLHGRVRRQKIQHVCNYYEDRIRRSFPGLYRKFHDMVATEDLFHEDALDFITLRPTHDVIDFHDVVIFEGAQGIMLDQDHGFIPRTTWGYTTSRNAVELIGAFRGDCKVEVHHVTRAYQTRHGDGPMTSKPIVVPPDPTNFTNPYQGEFRTSQLDVSLLEYARRVDGGYLARIPGNRLRQPPQLHVTCCDHLDPAELETIKKELHDGAGWDTITSWSAPTRLTGEEDFTP